MLPPLTATRPLMYVCTSTYGSTLRRAPGTHLPLPMRKPAREYARLYTGTVLQADKGCDFEFLRASALPLPR